MPKFVFDHFTQACHMTRTFNTQVSTGGLGTTLGTVIILWSNKRILARFWQVLFRLASLFELWFWWKIEHVVLAMRTRTFELIHSVVFKTLQSLIAAKKLLSKPVTENICLFKSFQGSTWSIKPYICHTLVNIRVQQSEFSLPRIK